MRVTSRIIAVLLFLCFISGCYQDELELTLNPDGSGTIKQKLVFSERAMVVASDTAGEGERMPPATKEKVVDKIGEAFYVALIKQTDMPDGGRIIEYEGTFKSPEQLFFSDFCREIMKLRIASAGDNKVAIYCDMGSYGGGGSGPDLIQLYGLLKGLYIKRSVRLPGLVENTNGELDRGVNTVSWAIDLRNRGGLAKTRGFIEGPDEGKGSAIFSAAVLGFDLPLKASELEAEASVKEQPSKGEAGFAVKVAAVSVQRTMEVSGVEVPRKSFTEIEFELSWDEEVHPVRHERPVLLSLSDDLGNDMVANEKTSSFASKIYGHQKKKRFEVKAKVPTKGAKSLKNLQGYVEVVEGVKTETVVLEKLGELAGKDSTGNPVLDNLHFKIESTENDTIAIRVDGGGDTIQSLALIKEDGSKIARAGGMGGGDKYSYEFKEAITETVKCELDVVVSEIRVKVPFSADEVVLP